MTPPIWSDVSSDLAVALAQAQRAEVKAATLPSLMGEAREDRELAVGKHLHDAYSAAESALERLVIAVDGELPKGSRYHQDLLRRAAHPVEGLRGPMIGPETHRLLAALVTFRHAFRHAYGAFDWPRASPNVALAARAMPMLAEDLAAFSEAMGFRTS